MPLLHFTVELLSLYSILIVIEVVLSLLFSGGIIQRVDWAEKLHSLLYKITEPAYAVVRRVLPPISGIDFSPLGVIVIIHVLQWMLYRLAAAVV